jgi:hypothetical protein
MTMNDLDRRISVAHDGLEGRSRFLLLSQRVTYCEESPSPPCRHASIAIENRDVIVFLIIPASIQYRAL